MRSPTSRKPWLLVVGAFLLLIAAWSVLIYIAVKNRPAAVPLESSSRTVPANETA